MRLVATIEARMGSTRVPGKSIVEIEGKPLLEHVIGRIRLISGIDDIVVATSTKSQDDAIEAVARRLDVAVFRGSEDDVLERVVQAAESRKAELTVQFSGDSPFIDWQVVEFLRDRFYDYPDSDLVTNCLELTYPLGVYTYVVPMATMLVAHAEAKKPKEREDVTRYIWENPQKFKLRNYEAPPELHRPEIRLTVDYLEDIELTRQLYRRLLPQNPRFTTRDVLAIFEREPELAKINAGCVQHSAPHLTQTVQAPIDPASAQTLKRQD
ncbi:MAG: glycosyltransferase family protein [Cyanobacteria bacterium REEB65]|nr:glycosyltransferase family protein [Cyanobacteria bacterium REEB65]